MDREYQCYPEEERDASEHLTDEELYVPAGSLHWRIETQRTVQASREGRSGAAMWRTVAAGGPQRHEEQQRRRGPPGNEGRGGQLANYGSELCCTRRPRPGLAVVDRTAPSAALAVDGGCYSWHLQRSMDLMGLF